MVSVELDLKELPASKSGALLLNWSFRGQLGAHAKIFVDGVQDVETFPISSTDEDQTPNFWSIVPWGAGRTVIDLKHVGAGYCWFEHVDVHSIIW